MRPHGGMGGSKTDGSDAGRARPVGTGTHRAKSLESQIVIQWQHS